MTPVQRYDLVHHLRESGMRIEEVSHPSQHRIHLKVWVKDLESTTKKTASRVCDVTLHVGKSALLSKVYFDPWLERRPISFDPNLEGWMQALASRLEPMLQVKTVQAEFHWARRVEILEESASNHTYQDT